MQIGERIGIQWIPDAMRGYAKEERALYLFVSRAARLKSGRMKSEIMADFPALRDESNSLVFKQKNELSCSLVFLDTCISIGVSRCV